MAEKKIKDQKSKVKIKDQNVKVSKVKKPEKTKDLVRKSSKKVKEEKIAAEASVKLKEKEISSSVNTKEDKALTIPVHDISGKEIETLELPKEIFGAKVNKILMAQAVRVYLANQRQGNASTKTRGEVTGSTRKIYRQKGTGRARHGGVRAPIFVHGGIAHGPKPQDHSLDMPKKMKKAALFSALTTKLLNNEIKIVNGLDTIQPKTKVMAQTLSNFGLTEEKVRLLVVMPETNDTVVRTGRNLERVTITAADRVNTYAILHAKQVIFMKDAIRKLEETFIKEKSKNS